MTNYKQKYLKYKTKYLELKGVTSPDEALSLKNSFSKLSFAAKGHLRTDIANLEKELFNPKLHPKSRAVIVIQSKN